MIMVDELTEYPATPWPARKYGIIWCHMSTDDTSDEGIAELHRLAASIGCSRSWFQGKAGRRMLWHYDLVESMRDKALKAGAVFVPKMDQARARVAAMRASRVLLTLPDDGPASRL